MKSKHFTSVVFAAALACAGTADATDITFENLAIGTTLSNQYLAMGVIFSPNAFSGAGTSSSGQNWASNTDMTIVSSTGTDVGGLGTPALVSGNLLHSYNGWLSEDGDASFTASFTTPVSTFSAAFAGVSTPADVRLIAYNGSTLLGTVAGTVATGQFTLSFSAPSITRVVVTPGSYFDWVGVDNLHFVAVVPEPGTYALMAVGLVGVLGFKRSRSRDRAAV